MFDAWLTDGLRRKNDNTQIKRAFQAAVLRKISERPIRALTVKELRTILRTIVERNAHRAAVLVHNDLTRTFPGLRSASPDASSSSKATLWT